MTSRRAGRVEETVSIGPGDPNKQLALVVTTRRGSFTKKLPSSGTIRIGRSDECEIHIDDHAISRVHAVVHLDRMIGIEDLGSRNGTVVLGTRIGPNERIPLPLGAVVEIGHAVLVLARAQDERVELDASVVLASKAMRELFDTVPVIAASPLCILVLGETGVGKDVLVRAIHRSSNRASGPLVALNCAALPESILESELFGYVKGAFTGAQGAKTGLFEAAHGGTLFLDEVGELSPTTQAKLLRVVETGEVMPLGSVQPKQVDTRFVAATNRDLRGLVREGRFREDLFFRLQGVTLRVPPLRERQADIMPLAESFASAVAARLGAPAPRFDSEAIAALEHHPWPGNVRELRSVIERAVTLSRGAPRLRAEDFSLVEPDVLGTSPSSVTMPPPAAPVTERDRIVVALNQAAGNQTVAAKLLGVSRRTLIRRIEEYAIGRPRKDA